MLRLPGVFLRRPLSIYGTREKRVEFLYRIAGKGTGNLARMKPGETIEVLGPLGTGYAVSLVKKKTLPLLVAGGTGIASLSFLALQLERPGVLFYGAKSKKDFVCIDNFKKAGWQLQLSTEDGSSGFKGYVTDLFAQWLEKERPVDAVMYGCGPKVMLQKAAAICVKHALSGQVSLEEMMACGLGNCQGCAVKTSSGHKMACKDGPVFDIEGLEW